MNRFRKLAVIALLIAVLVVSVAPAAAKVTVVFLDAGDPSQWGVEESLTRKVNEYEGQHRIAGDPSQWGVGESLTRKVNEYEGQHRIAGDPSQWGVEESLTRKVNEYEGQH